MSSSSKKSRKFAKASDVLFYLGLFFFIFAIAVLISLAAKGTFSPDQQIESGGIILSALVGVFGGVGIISLFASLILNLKSKKEKRKELEEMKNKNIATTPSKPAINVNNVEAQNPESPVININIPQQNTAPRPATVQSQPRVVVNPGVAPRPAAMRPQPRVVVNPSVSPAGGRTVIRTADGRLISVNTNRGNVVRPGTVPTRPAVK